MNCLIDYPLANTSQPHVVFEQLPNSLVLAVKIREKKKTKTNILSTLPRQKWSPLDSRAEPKRPKCQRLTTYYFEGPTGKYVQKINKNFFFFKATKLFTDVKLSLLINFLKFSGREESCNVFQLTKAQTPLLPSAGGHEYHHKTRQHVKSSAALADSTLFY